MKHDDIVIPFEGMFIEFVPIVEYLHGFVLSNSSKDNDCIDKVLRKRTFTTSSMIIQCQHLSTPRLMFTLTEKISTFPEKEVEI
ncbi:CCR4-Not complex 3'-5'-exoribonuclease subunit [Trichinella pseudospiralis]